MPSDAPKLVWLDAEMTGLDLEVDELIEIAAYVTDYELNILDDGIHIVIKPSAHALDQMGDFVRAMHTDSGLLDELADGVGLEEAENLLMDYLTTHLPEPKTAPLAGNTIGTDRAFLQRYMPQVHDYLHYRNIDVSTIKELGQAVVPQDVFPVSGKKRWPQGTCGHSGIHSRTRLLPGSGLCAYPRSIDHGNQENQRRCHRTVPYRQLQRLTAVLH